MQKNEFGRLKNFIEDKAKRFVKPESKIQYFIELELLASAEGTLIFLRFLVIFPFCHSCYRQLRMVQSLKHNLRFSSRQRTLVKEALHLSSKTN